jgi:HEAT repeat protein
MLDATSKKLLRLLRSDVAPEVRRAAALVLGEVGARDDELADALCALLADPDAPLRAQVMTAIGKLRVEQALPALLTRASQGGEEGEVAALAAARLGPKGTRALHDMMGKVAPGLRRRFASALAAAGTPSAETVAVDTLLDKDPGVVDAALRSLIAEVPTLTDAHRKGLADHLLELLAGAKKNPLSLPRSGQWSACWQRWRIPVPRRCSGTAFSQGTPPNYAPRRCRRWANGQASSTRNGCGDCWHVPRSRTSAWLPRR